jgi:antitoxin component YwqK of YwqJK toxin-antitoxin module
MRRVRAEALQYAESGLYCLAGEPFTGVVVTYDGHQIAAEAEYRDGMPWGTELTWHPNGSPEGDRQCVAGLRHGLGSTWDDQGNLVEYELCELGVAVWRKRWENGRLIEDYTLAEGTDDFKTLEMLRNHYMREMRHLGERRFGPSQPECAPPDADPNGAP